MPPTSKRARNPLRRCSIWRTDIPVAVLISSTVGAMFSRSMIGRIPRQRRVSGAGVCMTAGCIASARRTPPSTSSRISRCMGSNDASADERPATATSRAALQDSAPRSSVCAAPDGSIDGPTASSASGTWICIDKKGSPQVRYVSGREPSAPSNCSSESTKAAGASMVFAAGPRISNLPERSRYTHPCGRRALRAPGIQRVSSTSLSRSMTTHQRLPENARLHATRAAPICRCPAAKSIEAEDSSRNERRRTVESIGGAAPTSRGRTALMKPNLAERSG